MAPTIRELIRRNRHAWRIAVENPMVASVLDGTLEEERLARWIVPARARLENLFPFLCRLLAMAPGPDRGVLLEVLRALAAELRWIDGWMERRGLDPGIPVNLVVRSQMSHHATLAFRPYVVGLVAFLVDFRIYADAWSQTMPASGPHRELIRHWAQVAALEWPGRVERAADRALAAATPEEIAEVEGEVQRVIQDRLSFWTMMLG